MYVCAGYVSDKLFSELHKTLASIALKSQQQQQMPQQQIVGGSIALASQQQQHQVPEQQMVGGSIALASQQQRHQVPQQQMVMGGGSGVSAAGVLIDRWDARSGFGVEPGIEQAGVHQHQHQQQVEEQKTLEEREILERDILERRALVLMRSVAALDGRAGMHFAYVPMSVARAVTVGTVLGYHITYVMTGFPRHAMPPRCLLAMARGLCVYTHMHVAYKHTDGARFI